MNDNDTKNENNNPKTAEEEKTEELQVVRERVQAAIDKTEKCIGDCLEDFKHCPRALMEYTVHVHTRLGGLRGSMVKDPGFTKDLVKCLIGMECQDSDEELEKRMLALVGGVKTAGVAITSEGKVINLPKELKKRLGDIQQRVDAVEDHAEIEKMTETETTMRKAMELLMAMQEKDDIGSDKLN